MASGNGSDDDDNADIEDLHNHPHHKKPQQPPSLAQMRRDTVQRLAQPSSRSTSSFKQTTLMLPPVTPHVRPATLRLLEDLTSRGYETRGEFLTTMANLKRKHKLQCKNSYVRQVYLEEVAEGRMEEHPQMDYFFRTKVGKSASGILSITVFTSPYPQYTDPETGQRRTQKFTCEWNCYFCPNHPEHPRSYLPDEPGCLRAERCGFDAAAQLTERVATLEHLGHPVDKLEVLVLGGTWESYPQQYQEEYVRDLFWAANTFFDPEPRRERGSLPQEQLANESTKCKIIGLTLETRPDTISAESIRMLRYYGCTRLQIGLQHVDNDILDLVNRRHHIEDGVRALKLLKDNCYKVDIHLMPDLPGSSFEQDRAMFHSLLGLNNDGGVARRVGAHSYEYDLVNEDVQADQWKVYPCEVTPWTVIEQWQKEGKYRPYGGDGPQLVDLLIDMKRRVFPWIRLNRIVRDIPNQHIIGGNSTVNLRQGVVRLMKQRGFACRCIRCREVGLNSEHVTVTQIEQAVLVTRRYEANDGVEYFLSFESEDESVLFGFVRLRIALAPDEVFPCLRNAGLIRELHVYGQLIPTYRCLPGGEESSQHSGFGSRLMRQAEDISWQHGCVKTAVIAGIGTRNYYRKLGYELCDTFMIRHRALLSRVVGHRVYQVTQRYPLVVMYLLFIIASVLVSYWLY